MRPVILAVRYCTKTLYDHSAITSNTTTTFSLAIGVRSSVKHEMSTPGPWIEKLADQDRPIPNPDAVET